MHMSVSGNISETHGCTDTMPIRFHLIRPRLTVDLHNVGTAVGHNLGGMHPFYDAEITEVGQIGGIMDYGGL